MKVNLLKDEFKSLEKFYKLLTPRIHNNKRAFEQILYPEKRSPPLSSEISKRTRIISRLKNEIEGIYVQNEEYFSQLKEFNTNKNTNANSIEKNIKNKLKKTTLNSSGIYENNKEYSENLNIKQLSNSRNNIFPFLKSATKIKIINRNNNLSSNREEDHNIKLNKIKASLLALTKDKNIINRNRTSNLSSLTDINVKNNFFKNEKKVIRKTISSSVLSDTSINFRKEIRKSNLNVLKPCQSNITFSNCITSYTDKKSKNNQYLRNKISSRNNNYKSYNNAIFNSQKNYNNLSDSKKNVYSNYNNIFSDDNSTNNKYFYSNSKDNNFLTSIQKISKFNLLKKNKIINPNNLKNVTNSFKKHFHKKIIFLNYNMYENKKILTNLVEGFNQDIIKTKEIEFKKDEMLKEELDIRKDILNDENELKENYDDKNRYRINPKNNEQIKSLNLLKKNINVMKENDALKIIERLVDKSQREKLDVKKLLEDYYNKKKEKEVIRIAEIRKKAEKNYKKLIKLQFNL